MAPTNHRTSALPVARFMTAGPGQKPASPQPMPNRAAPTHSRASRRWAVGKSIGSPNTERDRRLPQVKASTPTPIAPLIAEARALGVRVSLFMDPDAALMPWARELGADRVELYTEPYAAAHADPAQRAQQIERYAQAARAARGAGLGVNAGHDLNRDNLGHFLEQVPGVAEVSIGHAFIADALELGYADTVRAYLQCITTAEQADS